MCLEMGWIHYTNKMSVFYGLFVLLKTNCIVKETIYTNSRGKRMYWIFIKFFVQRFLSYSYTLSLKIF